jgi:hypothetical protein
MWRADLDIDDQGRRRIFKEQYIDSGPNLVPIYHDEENSYLKGGYTDEKMGDALIKAVNKYKFKR